MKWEWYQKRIVEFFRRVPDARVAEDVKVQGKSGVSRHLDVQIFVPIEVKFSKGTKVTLDIQIIVDATDHAKPLGFGLVELVDELRADVGAHLALIASPKSFTLGARNRAWNSSIVLMTGNTDLLNLMRTLKIHWPYRCQNFLCPEGPGYVEWTSRQKRHQAAVGACQLCNVLHVLCPDCGSVIAVHDINEGKPLKCPGCPCIYRASRHEVNEQWIEGRDELDVLLMTAAYKNKLRRISLAKAETIISRTKWQDFDALTHHVVDSGLMEWTSEGEFLVLTESGIEDYEEFIRDAEDLPQ